jgi:HK97 family phage portal protein
MNLPAIFRFPGLLRKSFALAQSIYSNGGSTATSWLSGLVREPYPGAWQKNDSLAARQNITAFSAVFACIAIRAGDIGKLRMKLMQRFDPGYWVETTSPSFSPVLRRPNRYQTRIQFLTQWVVSKLLHGNTYVLKERDSRGVVVALYILDAPSVTPKVAPDGSIYYGIKRNYLAGIEDEDITVPADEIIHDRGLCLFHPLIGVSPIFACAASAMQGVRIQANSSAFFANMSRPSGHLTAPAAIDDKTAKRIQQDFEANYRGTGLGGLLVTGQNIKYEAMTIPAADAQLIEQLKWTVEDVVRCFKVPLYKISNVAAPSYNNIAALNQDYYSQCLQEDIECIEELLDQALGIGPAFGGSAVSTYGVELDIEGLVRMDPASRAEANTKNVMAGVFAPDEARLRENLPPVPGGSKPFMQQQMFPLDALANRAPPADVAPKPTADAGPVGSTPAEPPAPAADTPSAPAASKAIEPDQARAAHVFVDQLLASFAADVE